MRRAYGSNTVSLAAAEEERLRVDLAAAYRLCALYGWDDQLSTHISVRLPGPRHQFLMNPYGLMFDEITASSLVEVDISGQVADCSANAVNAAGFTIHSAIHAARADANCVMHLHTVAGCAVSTQKSGLLPLTFPGIILQGRLGYHDLEGVTVEPGEKERIVANLGDGDGLIFRNHGTLTVGHTVAEAFRHMYFLERACQIQVAATRTGDELILPPEGMDALVRDQLGASFAAAADRVWTALLRKLDRESPGYRE